MRFNYGRLGEQPAAGLIGAAITNPIDLTASSGSFVKSDDSSTFHSPEPGSDLPVIRETNDSIDSSVSYGRMDARESYNEKLLGVDSPSWTHASIGQNQSYVIGALTSSRHEETNLNLQTSGTQFYSKEQSLLRYTGKKTASLDDLIGGKDGTYRDVITPDGYPQQNGAAVYPACSTFLAGTGTLCELTGDFIDAPSGRLTSSPYAPAVFTIDIPVSGRLVDIKVWVELIHVSSSAPTDIYEPLAGLSLALRSPNVHFRSCYPIANDPKFQKWSAPGESIFDNASAWDDGSPPRLFSSTYLLWEGACNVGVNPSLETFAGSIPALERSRYPTFNNDRSIRVVFTDGSSIPNPRHLQDNVSVSGNFVGSPNESFGLTSAWGAQKAWTSDTAVSDPNSAAGSPPSGWLTGPAKTADTNEWPTTGSNYGAITMRPVYPMLDDLYEIKRVSSDSTFSYITGSVTSTLAPIASTEFGNSYRGSGASAAYVKRFNDARDWRGFRPGLRGTEIQGRWMLYVGATPNSGEEWQVSKLYFRQFRLELTYEKWAEGAIVNRAGSPLTAQRPGPKLLCLLSGSGQMNEWSFQTQSFFNGPGRNYYINEVYTTIPEKAGLGRTFGVTANTGTFREENYALLYRLTGSLADISGSVPSWLFSAPGGMPQIPESSASLVPVSAESTPPRTNDFVVENASPPKILRDASYEIHPPLKRTQIAHLFVSSSTR